MNRKPPYPSEVSEMEGPKAIATILNYCQALYKTVERLEKKFDNIDEKVTKICHSRARSYWHYPPFASVSRKYNYLMFKRLKLQRLRQFIHENSFSYPRSHSPTSPVRGVAENSQDMENTKTNDYTQSYEYANSTDNTQTFQYTDASDNTQSFQYNNTIDKTRTFQYNNPIDNSQTFQYNNTIDNSRTFQYNNTIDKTRTFQYNNPIDNSQTFQYNNTIDKTRTFQYNNPIDNSQTFQYNNTIDNSRTFQYNNTIDKTRTFQYNNPIDNSQTFQYNNTIDNSRTFQYNNTIDNTQTFQYNNTIDNTQTFQYNNTVDNSRTFQYNNTIDNTQTFQYTGTVDNTQPFQYNNTIDNTQTYLYNNTIGNIQTYYNNTISNTQTFRYNDTIDNTRTVQYNNTIDNTQTLQYTDTINNTQAFQYMDSIYNTEGIQNTENNAVFHSKDSQAIVFARSSREREYQETPPSPIYTAQTYQQNYKFRNVPGSSTMTYYSDFENPNRGTITSATSARETSTLPPQERIPIQNFKMRQLALLEAQRAPVINHNTFGSSPECNNAVVRHLGKPINWSVNDVLTFLNRLDPPLADQLYPTIRKHNIDGKALMMINNDTMIKYLGMKVEVAMKFDNYIRKLKEEVNFDQQTNCL